VFCFAKVLLIGTLASLVCIGNEDYIVLILCWQKRIMFFQTWAELYMAKIFILCQQ